MRLVTEEDDWLSGARITPRAVEGLDELPRDERNAVLNALRVPFRSSRTEKMTQRGDIDLWRVRVNRDVRITYRVDDSSTLILHIGRHQAADAFVDRYQPKCENSQPLSELPLMKTTCKNPPTVVRNGSTLALERPRPLAEELARVLSAVVGEAVRDEQKTARDLALDELDRLGAAFRDLQDQLAEVTIEQESLTELPARLRELDRSLHEQRLQFEGNLAEREHRRASPDDLIRLLAELHELRLEVRECSTRLDEQTRRAQASRSDSQAQVNALSAQVEALNGVVEQMRAEQAARQRGWLGRLFRKWRA